MFGESNSFCENTPRNYFDAEAANSKCHTIMEDCSINNKRVQSAIKFSD